MGQFSAQQLHSSVPNTSGRTRFSIDFRTVDVADIRAGRGAINVDSHCTVVALLHDGTDTAGDLVYVPPAQPESAHA